MTRLVYLHMQLIIYVLFGSILGTTLLLVGFYLGVKTVKQTYLEITDAHYSDTNIDKEEQTEKVSQTDPYNWDEYDEYITGDQEFEDVPEA